MANSLKPTPQINILAFSLQPSPTNDTFTRFLAPTPKERGEGLDDNFGKGIIVKV